MKDGIFDEHGVAGPRNTVGDRGMKTGCDTASSGGGNRSGRIFSGRLGDGCQPSDVWTRGICDEYEILGLPANDVGSEIRGRQDPSNALLQSQHQNDADVMHRSAAAHALPTHVRSSSPDFTSGAREGDVETSATAS